MPTFIDETGDTGSYSSHFHLCAVWVPDSSIVQQIRESIQQARIDLKVNAQFEFKFSRTSKHPHRRHLFFQQALRHDFSFAVSSVDKSHVDWNGESSEAIHLYVVTGLAVQLIPSYCNYLLARQLKKLGEVIVVDNNEDESFRMVIRNCFLGLGRSMDPPVQLVKRVKWGKSHADDLLQLADMVCGAAAARIEGDRQWYDLIADRDLRR